MTAPADKSSRVRKLSEASEKSKEEAKELLKAIMSDKDATNADKISAARQLSRLEGWEEPLEADVTLLTSEERNRKLRIALNLPTQETDASV